MLNFQQYIKKISYKLQKQIFFQFPICTGIIEDETERVTGEGHRYYYLAQVSNIHNYLVIAVLFLEYRHNSG